MEQCKVCLKEVKHCSCAHHHVPHKKNEIPLPKEEVKPLPEHHITNDEKVVHDVAPAEEEHPAEVVTKHKKKGQHKK